MNHTHYRMLFEKFCAREKRPAELATFLDWLDAAKKNYFPRAWETLVTKLDAHFPDFAKHPLVLESIAQRRMAGRPAKPGNKAKQESTTKGSAAKGSAAVPAASSSPLPPGGSGKGSMSIVTRLNGTKKRPSGHSFETMCPRMSETDLERIGSYPTPPAPIDGLGYPIGYRPATALQGVSA